MVPVRGGERRTESCREERRRQGRIGRKEGGCNKGYKRRRGWKEDYKGGTGGGEKYGHERRCREKRGRRQVRNRRKRGVVGKEGGRRYVGKEKEALEAKER